MTKIKETDVLQRFIFDNAPVRGEHVYLHHSFQEILSQHPYPAPIRQLLGEVLCVVGLLSAIIKFDGRLTVQFRGEGKLKLLMAQCDTQLSVRGLAKWDGEISYDDLMDAFNQGVLMIRLDSGRGKHYQGVVRWTGNSLVESVEGYFRESEQLATRLWLSVDEKSAAGFLLQIIPGTEKTPIGIEEEIIQPTWERIIRHTQPLQPEDLLDVDYRDLLNKLYPDEDIRVFPPTPVKFHCTCSRKRGEDAILILGQEEAEEELKNKNSIIVTCEFCNREYIFDKVDITSIFKNRDDQSSQTKH